MDCFYRIYATQNYGLVSINKMSENLRFKQFKFMDLLNWKIE